MNKVTSIKDLFTQGPNLTFLVGAGCSIDPPSCLPAGQAMMESIIKYCCAESEIENLLNLEDLRFEGLIETLRDYLDSDLKIIDFYGECDKPNLQHLFLADMIEKGHFVMTTNFDFLIEYALKQKGIPDDQIRVVITKADFKTNDDPNSLVKKNIKALYKIHGSTKNIINEEETKETLIATIQAFGSNKEGLDVFQIEPYKKSLFENIAKGRTLVVMGYSGSDDFDIVPTLKILKELERVVWINYEPDDNGQEHLYEIDQTTIENPIDDDKVNEILTEIYLMGHIENIYRVNVNTSRIIKEILGLNIEEMEDPFEIDPIVWIEEHLPSPTEIEKLSIPASIYLNFSKYNNIIRIASKGLKRAREKGSRAEISHFLNLLGLGYHHKSNNEEALKYFKEAYKIDQELGVIANKITGFINMSLVYSNLGEFNKAEKILDGLLALEEVQNDPEKKAKIFTTKGSIYKKRGLFPGAIKNYEKALKINEELGNLYGLSVNLNNIGGIYSDLRKFSKATQYLEQALKIRKELGYYRGLVSTCLILGGNNRNQGKYNEALAHLNKALDLSEKISYKDGIGKAFNRIGTVYLAQRKYDKAYKYLKPALEIIKETGNQPGMILANTNLGTYYIGKKEYVSAIDMYKKSIEIAENIGAILEKAHAVYNIGLIHYEIGRYKEALQYFLETLELYNEVHYERGKGSLFLYIGEIYMKSGSPEDADTYFQKSLKVYSAHEESEHTSEKQNLYINLGINQFNQQKYEDAMPYFEMALNISQKLNDKPSQYISYNNIGLIYQTLGEYENAIENFQNALEISSEIGDSEAKLIHLQNLAINYFYNEDFKSTEEYISQAFDTLELHEDPNLKSNLLNILGVISYKREDYENALSQYRNALKANPENDVAHYNIACVCSIQKNVEYALKYLQNAIALNPQYKKNAQDEKDFQNIADLEEFKAIINEK